MPTYEYKDWLVAMDAALRTARPDVRPEDLDPNLSFAAFQAGTSPHAFATQAILPLRTPLPAPSRPAPAPASVPSAARSGRLTWGALAVAAVVVAALAVSGSQEDPMAHAMRGVAEGILSAYRDRGYADATIEFPGFWADKEVESRPMSEVLHEREATQGAVPARIESWRITKVTVQRPTDAERLMPGPASTIGYADADVVGTMADGRRVEGDLSLQYDLDRRQVGVVEFTPKDGR